MSGLEVAGVVLGALPLVISALEHYARGAESVKIYYRYKIQLQNLIDAVKTQKVIFTNTLEQLLTGIVPADKMTAVIADPAAHPKVDLRLKGILRDGYDAYFSNVRGMQVALATVMAKLKLDADGKPQFTDLSLFKQEYRRLKFSINKSAYDEHLRDLRHYNNSLAQLTGHSRTLEPSRRRATPNFKAIQAYAKNLYQTLLTSLQCGCQSHAVNLRMECRTPTNRREHESSSSAPFRVVFTQADPSTHLVSSWKEVEIRHIQDAFLEVPQAPKGQQGCPSPNKKRTVRFGSFQMQFQRSSSNTKIKGNATLQVKPTPATPTTQTIQIQTPKAQMTQIQNLCVTIAQLPSQHDACAGYLLDDSQQKHALYSKSPDCIQQPWKTYTLDQILAGTQDRLSPLSLRDKLKIAVDLASGVIQLHKTPWMNDIWKQNDVLFVLRPGTPQSTLYEHPFVYRELCQTTTQQATNTSSAANSRVIRNQTLYILGIVLIELCYGRNLQAFQEPEDLQCDGTPGVEWCTADRLLRTNDLENHVGKRYADAVRRCVYCDFGVDNADLADENFQQVVYEGVLEKLEESLQHIEG